MLVNAVAVINAAVHLVRLCYDDVAAPDGVNAVLDDKRNISRKIEIHLAEAVYVRAVVHRVVGTGKGIDVIHIG